MNEHVSRTQSENARLQPTFSRTALEIESMTISYGANTVLNELSLKVPVGSIFGFLGANGAGKTTTINTLLGFRPPTSGSIRVLGYDVVCQQREMHWYVGYVSETSSLYDFLNVSQLCDLSRDMHQHWSQAVVDRYLQMFALPLNKRVKQFSKGMKSQLALCLALGHDLLILDEPTTGLDPIARQVFLTTLVREVAATGKTVFFSSHILSEVEAIADRVAILHHGTIVLSDELDSLREMQKILRLTYVKQQPAEEITVLRRLTGVRQLEQEGRTVEGDVDEITQTIQERPYAIRDLEVVPVRLEEVLLEYMRGDGA